MAEAPAPAALPRLSLTSERRAEQELSEVPPLSFSFPTPVLPSPEALQAASSSDSTSASQEAGGPSLFEPPPVVHLVRTEHPVTGEEDETVFFSVRAKSFMWGVGNGGPQWKERGVGELRLLRHKQTALTRLVMRRDRTLKLCANHTLSEEMVLQKNLSCERSWIYLAHSDFSDLASQRATFAFRFKSKETADQFRAAFDEARSRNCELQAHRETSAEAPAKAPDEAGQQSPPPQPSAEAQEQGAAADADGDPVALAAEALRTQLRLSQDLEGAGVP